MTAADILKHCQAHGLPVPANLQRAVAPAAEPAIPARPRSTIGSPDVVALSITLPIKTVSESNTRRGARSKMTRTKAQRNAVRDRLRAMALHLPRLPATVTVTRIGKRLLDTCNLPSAVKAIEDGIADVYGVDDGQGERDGSYRWVREQRVGAAYAVEIKIEAAGAADGTVR